MMKLKPIRRPRGASQGKLKSSSANGRPQRVGDENPGRLWSLLLPPGYFREWK
jgi:hypothetical protein